MSQFRIRFTGDTTLVMHNNRCVNPLDPFKKKIAAITSKGSKKLTDGDYKALYRLEFQAGMYYSEVDPVGPYIPQKNIRATLINGARKNRDGKQFESGLHVHGDAPLIYEGPRDLQGLMDAGDFDSGGFMWTTVCGNQRASIMRTRPRFRNWSIEFDVSLMDELIDLPMLENALEAAGLQVGICDARSIGEGRFEAMILDQPANNGKASNRIKKHLVSE